MVALSLIIATLPIFHIFKKLFQPYWNLLYNLVPTFCILTIKTGGTKSKEADVISTANNQEILSYLSVNHYGSIFIFLY